MNSYVAGRDLYRDGRRVFTVGAPVPEDAYPAETMDELWRNGGLRRVEVEASTIEVPTVGEAEPATDLPHVPEERADG